MLEGPKRDKPGSSGVQRGVLKGFHLQGWKNFPGKCEEMRGKSPPPRTLAGTPVAGSSGRLGVGQGEGSKGGGWGSSWYGPQWGQGLRGIQLLGSSSVRYAGCGLPLALCVRINDWSTTYTQKNA